LKKVSKREIALSLCRIAGYHNDSKAFARVFIENRLSMKVAQNAFAEGANQRKSGMKCSCRECREAAGAV
jgi:hypothetical protein